MIVKHVFSLKEKKEHSKATREKKQLKDDQTHIIHKLNGIRAHSTTENYCIPP